METSNEASVEIKDVGKWKNWPVSSLKVQCLTP